MTTGCLFPSPGSGQLEAELRGSRRLRTGLSSFRGKRSQYEVIIVL